MAKKILDPRANATKGVYEKFLRDKAAKNNTANVGSSFYSPGGMKFGTDAYTPTMSTSQYVAGQAQGKANQPGLGDVDWGEVQRRIDAQNANAGANVTGSFYSPGGMKYGVDTPLPTMGEYAAGQAQAQANKVASRNPWLDKLASFGAEGDPAAEEARIAFAENLEIIDPLAAAKLREQVALNGIGNVNDPNVFQWNKGVGAAGNQIGLVPAGTPPPAGGPPPPGGTPPPPPAGGPPPPVGGDMGVVGGGSPLDRQIGIVEEALSEREAAIQIMLDEGLIDIEAAQALYDTERERVYNDFLAEQAGVITGFENEMAAAQAERTADRDALNAQLIAAGIDPALVADELAMIDATYQGGRDAERDYLDALGRIGTSADADRALLGEAVFGGFGQDLRSTAREMDLNAALMAAEDRQTARERGLSSELLSAFTGVPEGAMFGGQYAGVDTAGLAEGRLDRASQERIAAANLAQELALADRNFNELSAAEQLKFTVAGIDPTTGQYLDPNNPFAGLSPFEEWEARQQGQRPLTDLVYLMPGIFAANPGLEKTIEDTINDLATAGQTLGDEQLLNILGVGGVPADVLLDLVALQQQMGSAFFGDAEAMKEFQDMLAEIAARNNATPGSKPPPNTGGQTVDPNVGVPEAREQIYDMIGVTGSMGFGTIEEAYNTFVGNPNDPFMGDTGRMTLAEAQAEYDAYTASL